MNVSRRAKPNALHRLAFKLILKLGLRNYQIDDKYCFIDNNLGCEQDINNYGSVSTSLFIHSLNRKQYLSAKISPKRIFIQLSLLLFEERAFLHPPQQIKLA